MKNPGHVEDPQTEHGREESNPGLRRLEAIVLDESPDLVAITTFERRILYWSKGAEVATGWKASEAMGKDFLELLHTSGASKMEEAFACVMAGGTWQGEVELVLRDNRKRSFHGRWKLIEGGHDVQGGVLLVNSDVTAFNTASCSARPKDPQDKVRVLTSGNAHELNNVFAPMLIGADVLESICPGQEQREMIDMIRESARRGSQIVQQIMEVARPEKA